MPSFGPEMQRSFPPTGIRSRTSRVLSEALERIARGAQLPARVNPNEELRAIIAEKAVLKSRTDENSIRKWEEV